jgi:hypothetical protein
MLYRAMCCIRAVFCIGLCAELGQVLYRAVCCIGLCAIWGCVLYRAV